MSQAIVPVVQCLSSFLQLVGQQVLGMYWMLVFEFYLKLTMKYFADSENHTQSEIV